ncbi:hypothetical protein RHGRI_034560 [Rhododendron griersonianum]|uniref:O-fucosyltransferase family protein n=1 Tax=Rhododendron griersonianum TaxID=479676 RepID=A0AAV6I4C5_9ERIC|nr:hypothetical protein RHGRI_034560 [Rhododendron griersonianum]
MCLDGDMWIVACLLDLILEVAAIMGSGVETIRCLNSCNDGWLLVRLGSLPSEETKARYPPNYNLNMKSEYFLPFFPVAFNEQGNYISNGFLKVSCNGGLNQMRAAICDMVAVARLLNLTLVVPELDKTSFWADPSNFDDIFDVKHFIDSLRDEVRIVRRLPKRFNRKYGYQPLQMPPVSWSNEEYYLQKVCICIYICCTHGCTQEEAEELKRLRYAFPWWREKEILSEEKRLQGLCPLTPEEATLVLQALGFDKDMQIYIASGEIYGSQRRLAALRTASRFVKKEMLLEPEELQQFQNHSSQMAALDFMVSVASNVFIPTYDGNMARLVEGHRRYLGFKKTIKLDRRKLIELVDLHHNGTLDWDEFSFSVRIAHGKRMGQPTSRLVMVDKPKEEDYFYSNPQECLCGGTSCDDLLGSGNISTIQ